MKLRLPIIWQVALLASFTSLSSVVSVATASGGYTLTGDALCEDVFMNMAILSPLGEIEKETESAALQQEEKFWEEEEARRAAFGAWGNNGFLGMGRGTYAPIKPALVYENQHSLADGGAVSSAGDLLWEEHISILFKNNSAATGRLGGAIYTQGEVFFRKNGDITFSGNSSSSSSSSSGYGGAIYGETTMTDNENITFSGNSSLYSSSSLSSSGGAIYGTTTMSGNGDITFSENSSFQAGAINGTTIMRGNGDITFSKNTGGGIYGTTTMRGNGDITFSGNSSPSSSSVYGGAIYGETTMTDNENITFSGNSFSYSGGAIYGTTTMSGNGNITFSGNSSSSSSGGAIYGTTTMSGNGDITFSGNSSSSSSSSGGGAIYGTTTMSGNGNITFSGNSSSSSGGAIYGTTTMSGNGNITFSKNTGVCISAGSSDGSFIKLENNKEILFTENEGGGIYGTTTMSENGDITFSKNTSGISGKIVTLENNKEILFTENEDGGISGTTTMSGNGDITFSGNSSYSGGAIRGTTTMRGNGNITFSGNSATDTMQGYGGAILGNTTMIGNGNITFLRNKGWGAISANSSKAKFIKLENNKEISFIENEGGAIRGGETIMMSGNENITFSKNKGSVGGISGTTITMSGNGNITFSGNSSSSSSGGAISGTTIMMSGNGDIVFSGNSSSSSSGGAIYGTTTMSGNGDITFSGNSSSSSSSNGGGINGTTTMIENGNITFSKNTGGGILTYTGGVIEGFIKLENNKEISFIENQGGAIRGGETTMRGNGDITFSGNFSYYYGGGGINGTTTMIENGNITFLGNFSRSYATRPSFCGGAICGATTMSGNGDIIFSGNSTTSSDSDGGAIYGATTMSGNGDIIFSGNSTTSSGSDSDSDSDGGAIYGATTMMGNGDIIFSGNSTSSVSGNSYGGAIYGDTTMMNNGDISFLGNFAASSATYNTSEGGAIYTYSDIIFEGNKSVVFRGNYKYADKSAQEKPSQVCLSSIYQNDKKSSVVLAADTGQHITFYDAAYFGGKTTLNQGADNSDSSSVTGKGRVVFSGKYVEEDLAAIAQKIKGQDGFKGNLVLDAVASRTTTFDNVVELKGGVLSVEDGAILKMNQSFAIDAGATAAVDAHSEISVKSGIILKGSLQNAGRVSGEVTMSEGASLLSGTITGAGDQTGLAAATGTFDSGITGSITIEEGARVSLGSTLVGSSADNAWKLTHEQAKALVSTSWSRGEEHTYTYAVGKNASIGNASIADGENVIAETGGSVEVGAIAEGGAVTSSGGAVSVTESVTTATLGSVNDGSLGTSAQLRIDNAVEHSSIVARSTDLQTVAGEKTVLGTTDSVTAKSLAVAGQNTSLENKGTIETQSLTVSGEKSRLVNNGRIQGETSSAGGGSQVSVQNQGSFINNGVVDSLVQVEKGALLGGSGVFGNNVMLGTGSILQVGNSPGQQVMAGALSIEAGTTLQFFVDGTGMAADAALQGWGSGTYSQLELSSTGSLFVGGELNFQLGFSADCLASIAQAKTATGNVFSLDLMTFFATQSEIDVLSENLKVLDGRITGINSEFLSWDGEKALINNPLEEGTDLEYTLVALDKEEGQYAIQVSGSLKSVSIPEPSSMTLSLISLAWLLCRRRRKV